MEVAAAFADAGVEVVVCSWDGDAVDTECVVTDLRSRHVEPSAAAQRVRTARERSGAVLLHKVDSTLRGNWPEEVAALAESAPVVMIPAYPDAGRTCLAGEVFVHGVPVTRSEFANDARSPVRTSTPANLLRAVTAGDAGALARWLASRPMGICVCDARTNGDIAELVQAARAVPSVVLCGPAAVARALAVDAAAKVRPRAQAALPGGPAVVVCGSRHPRSRAQAAAVDGIDGVTVLLPPAGLDADADAEVVALELAGRAHDAVANTGARTVVLLGGDTAEAFIGERSVRVLGSAGTNRTLVGTAVGRLSINGRDLCVITKPGGFGDDRTVADLLACRGGA